jgi:hypothetical protein
LIVSRHLVQRGAMQGYRREARQQVIVSLPNVSRTLARLP